MTKEEYKNLIIKKMNEVEMVYPGENMVSNDPIEVLVDKLAELEKRIKDLEDA